MKLKCDFFYVILVNVPELGWTRVGNVYPDRNKACKNLKTMQDEWSGLPIRVKRVAVGFTLQGRYNKETMDRLAKKYAIYATVHRYKKALIEKAEEFKRVMTTCEKYWRPQ